jgi:flagellar secretion chaperone FliS
MRASNPFSSYRQVATQTAPPGQLVLMLFDGALKSLDLALLGFKHADFAERNLAVHKNLSRALDIIRELNGSLDMTAGGELAQTLRGLYAYFDERISASNLKKSPVGIQEVIPMLRDLRDAWSAMLEGQGADFPAPDFTAAKRLPAATLAV